MNNQDKTKEQLIQELQELQVENNSLKEAMAKREAELLVAKEQAEENEENLSITLHSIGDGVIVTDNNGKIVRMNPIAEKLCGWTMADAIGKPLTEVFNIINTGTRKRVDNPVEKVLEYGEIVGLANHTSLISCDGTEYHIADSASPIKTKEGAICGVVLIFSDITERYAAQEKLKLSEETYRLIYDYNPVPIIIYDVETLFFLSVNNAAIEKYGYTREEFMKLTVLDVRPESEIERMKQSARLISHTVTKAGIFCQRKKNGDLIDVEIIRLDITFEGRNAKLCIAHDLTEHLQAERLLQEKNKEIEAQNEEYRQINDELIIARDQVIKSEEKYRLLFEWNPMPMAIYDAETLAILSVNNATVDKYGFSKEEFATMTLLDIRPESEYDTLKKSVKRIDSKISNAGVFLQKKKNGELMQVEMMRLDITYEGKKAKLVLANDVTERLKTERLLHEKNNEIEAQNEEYRQINEELIITRDQVIKSEEKYRLLYDNNPVPIIIYDIETLFVLSVNNASLDKYGYTREEFLKLTVLDVRPESEFERMKQSAKIINKTVTNAGIFLHKKKNGELMEVEIIRLDITFDGRNAKLCIAHDLTERIHAERMLQEKSDEIEAQNEEYRQVNEELFYSKERAEESDRLKTAFLHNMSHEIRTPMNAIMGFSELLVDNYNDKAKVEYFSDIINQRCNDLLVIIEDILDIAKIESGQLTVHLESCDIQELFNEMRSFFSELQVKLNKKHIDFILKAQCSPAESIIITDKVKLKQIFINLISNAFKFTDKGLIVGGCKLDSENNLLFYVSDTGIGIPKEKQNLIFERFIQLEPTPNRLYGGTGLGLSIVKGLIEVLGGKVWVESEVGRGTTFYFSLPYKASQPYEQKKVTLNVETIETVVQGKTILIVEDDSYNAAFIQEVLLNKGLTLISTEYGKEAVKIVRSQHIDLVLMDIGLPDIDGYEAIRKIKQQKPDLKIIAQTAFAASEDRFKALESGCIDYISKPLKSKTLLSVVYKHLA